MSEALILRAEGRSIKEKGVLAMEGPAVVRPQFPFLAVQARASTLLDRLSVARPGCCRTLQLERVDLGLSAIVWEARTVV